MASDDAPASGHVAVSELSNVFQSLGSRVVTARSSSRSRLGSLSTIAYRLILGAFVITLLAIDAVQARHTSFGWDFRAFYDGGHRFLHLESPYTASSLADLTSRQNFVYPAPTAALFAPLSLLPYHVAAVFFVCLSGVLLVAALRLVGVRDIGCYLAVLISAPALDSLEIGTISPLLAFLVALIWRFRSRVWVVATALSLLVLLKLFLWPLAVWLIATRRIKSVAIASAAVVVAVLVTAVPLGIGTLTGYPHLLRTVAAFEGPSSLSLLALGKAATGSTSAGLVLSFAGGLLLLVATAWRGRRGDEAQAFGLAILAGLALTPIVWNHYLVVLYIPLALLRPRFSPIWLGTAWVLGAVGGGAMGGYTLAAAIGLVWLAGLTQAGAFRTSSGGTWSWSFNRFSPGPRKLSAALALWGVLIAILVAMLGVVPAVAALHGTGSAKRASGTAALRLLSNDSVCVNALTSGVPAGSRLRLVDVGRRSILFDRELKAPRTEMCGPVAMRNGANLGELFAARKVRLSLRVVAPSGRVVLFGQVVRSNDAK